jgi:hypothetical protein
VLPRPAPSADPGIVHQDRDLAEGGVRCLPKALDVLQPAYVGRYRSNALGPAFRFPDDLGLGVLQPLAGKIG